MEVYLDACIAIYLVEEHPDHAMPIEARLRATGARVAYSQLVEMECLVLPMRLRREDLILRYQGLFARARRLPITDEVFRCATLLRADFGLKAPDALHLATAINYRCDELWTNDDRLAKAAGSLAVNVLAK